MFLNFILFFVKIVFLSNLNTQDPEIKSHVPHRLS